MAKPGPGLLKNKKISNRIYSFQSDEKLYIRILSQISQAQKIFRSC